MGRRRRRSKPEGENIWLCSLKRERGQNGKEHSEREWRIVFVPEGGCLQPSVISAKARIREIREKLAAEGGVPDPKYNKPPTPHEIRAGVARRRDGGKGVVEFLPGLFDIAEDDEPHLDGPEDGCITEEAEKVDDGQTRQGGEGSRHEVSLLDLPRGRVHRRKAPHALKHDGPFEWVGRRMSIDGSEQWEMGSMAYSEAWDDLASLTQFDEDNEWEDVDDVIS